MESRIPRPAVACSFWPPTSKWPTTLVKDACHDESRLCEVNVGKLSLARVLLVDVVLVYLFFIPFFLACFLGGGGEGSTSFVGGGDMESRVLQPAVAC